MEEIAADKTSVWHSKPSHVDLADAPGARAAPLPARPKPPRRGVAQQAARGRRLAARDRDRGRARAGAQRAQQDPALLGPRDAAAREGGAQGQADWRRRPHAAGGDADGRRHRRPADRGRRQARLLPVRPALPGRSRPVGRAAGAAQGAAGGAGAAGGPGRRSATSSTSRAGDRISIGRRAGWGSGRWFRGRRGRSTTRRRGG